MTSDEQEFLISQYVDGTLSPADRDIVDSLLLADPAARQILAHYRQLGSALVLHQSPPDVNWDRLTQHLSHHISHASDQPAVIGRIGFFQNNWRLAAAVLLTATLGLLGHRWFSAHQSQHASAPVASAIVIGPAAEVPHGTPVEEISVGPSPALAMHDADWRYGEGVVGRGESSVVLLDTLATPGHSSSHAN